MLKIENILGIVKLKLQKKNNAASQNRTADRRLSLFLYIFRIYKSIALPTMLMQQLI